MRTKGISSSGWFVDVFRHHSISLVYSLLALFAVCVWGGHSLCWRSFMIEYYCPFIETTDRLTVWVASFCRRWWPSWTKWWKWQTTWAGMWPSWGRWVVHNNNAKKERRESFPPFFYSHFVILDSNWLDGRNWLRLEWICNFGRVETRRTDQHSTSRSSRTGSSKSLLFSPTI